MLSDREEFELILAEKADEWARDWVKANPLTPIEDVKQIYETYKKWARDRPRTNLKNPTKTEG